MPIMPDAARLAAGRMKAHTTARAFTLRLGASGRREMTGYLACSVFGLAAS